MNSIQTQIQNAIKPVKALKLPGISFDSEYSAIENAEQCEGFAQVIRCNIRDIYFVVQEETPLCYMESIIFTKTK